MLIKFPVLARNISLADIRHSLASINKNVTAVRENIIDPFSTESEYHTLWPQFGGAVVTSQLLGDELIIRVVVLACVFK